MPLRHKVDFLLLVSVNRANPNGDPLCGNRPRTDSNGCGIITDVCIRRKLRNRLSQMGENILVTPPAGRDDSIAKRISGISYSDREEFLKNVCEAWFDVRCFGQVFALHKLPICTEGVRGAVSVQHGCSLHPVEITEIPITRCINSKSQKGRGSDTLGFKSFVNYGLYIIKGSINAYQAEKNCFQDSDADKLRHALCTIFENDASSTRPEGSMISQQLYWWRHSSAAGDYPSHIVFDTVKPRLCDGVSSPRCFEDYVIEHTPLPELQPEIYVFGRPMDVDLNKL